MLNIVRVRALVKILGHADKGGGRVVTDVEEYAADGGVEDRARRALVGREWIEKQGIGPHGVSSVAGGRRHEYRPVPVHAGAEEVAWRIGPDGEAEAGPSADELAGSDVDVLAKGDGADAAAFDGLEVDVILGQAGVGKLLFLLCLILVFALLELLELLYLLGLLFLLLLPFLLLLVVKGGLDHYYTVIDAYLCIGGAFIATGEVYGRAYGRQEYICDYQSTSD